jgi:tetratricopeptide (TPR) repeat protein/tRNA A-37 threonylcarbamoyl transferase component Bud32
MTADSRSREETAGEKTLDAPQHPASPRPPAAGPVIPGYEVAEELGGGGMGTVFRAHDPHLNRDLAVKVLHERYRDSAEMSQRFLEEAQITAQLQHPGIPPVHEVGTLADGRPFFAMKLVKGRTLGQLLAERSDIAGSLPGLLKIFEQICQTLAYAHARRVIHRDLKPTNVMVGAFGEVQVMDWGLAKVLSNDRRADAVECASPAASVIETGRPADDSATRAGTVLGTPAYMPPEQARGEVELIDLRADVFGLGAILCEILTGKPPYTGTKKEIEVHAKVGHLPPALARLDDCGAEHDLVHLARACLAAQPEQRLANAEVVATSITTYLNGVQEKLRVAEVERATAAARAEAEAQAKEAAEGRARAEQHGRELAQAKAREERRRRRLTVALALSVLLTAAIGGGFWLYLDQAESSRRSETEQGVNLALGRAEQLRDQARRLPADTPREAELAVAVWRQSLAAVQEAQGLLSAGSADEPTLLRVAGLHQEIEGAVAGADQALADARKDAKLLADLDGARALRVQAQGVVASLQPSERAYVAAFRSYGFDISRGPQQVADAIRQARSRVRLPLILALDECSLITGPAFFGNLALRQAAGLADNDPWRQQLREALNDEDLDELLRLARQARTRPLPAVSLGLLAEALRSLGADKEAIQLLRHALTAHPGDFWIAYMLGNALREPSASDDAVLDEAIGCYRAALALRPDNAMANVNLGLALYEKKELDGALAALRKASQLDPKNGLAQRGLANALRTKDAWDSTDLGITLYKKGELAGAIAAFQKAIKLEPRYAPGHFNLGNTLFSMKDLKGALAAYEQTMLLEPKNALAQTSLGLVLYDKKDLDGAIAAFGKAIELDTGYAWAQSSLSLALFAKKDMKGASAAYQKAIQLDRKNPETANSGQAGAKFPKAIALSPKYADAHIDLGIALTQSGAWDPAIAAFQKAIQLDPKLAPAHFNLGSVLQFKGDLIGALLAFQKAVQLDPKHLQANLQLGIIMEAGNPEGAIAAFQKVIQLDPNLVAAHIHLGRALSFKGDQDAAVAAYQKALQLDPKNAEAHNGLGTTLRNKNDLKGAIAAFQTATEVNPKNAESYLNLGQALQAAGRLDEAIAAFRKSIELIPNMAFYHSNLGYALRAKGDLDGAIAAYRKAVELAPLNNTDYENLGQALQDKGDLDGAIMVYRSAIRIYPQGAASHHLLGSALHAKKDLNGAIAAYQKAIKLDPNYSIAHLGLGSVLYDQKDFKGAVNAYRKAIQLNPKDASAHGHLGYALVEMGDMDEAIVACRKAIELDPKSAADHENLGFCLSATGDLDGAIQAYRTAVQLEPKGASGHTGLGLALQFKGDLEGAVAEFKQALVLDPKSAYDQACLGLALQGRGRLAESHKAFQRAAELIPKTEPEYPWYLKERARSERLLQIEDQLPALLEGKNKPASARQMLDLASLCARKRAFADALRFYRDGFAWDAGLAEDLDDDLRSDAADTAVLVAASQGTDVARAKNRQQALEWLRADLKAWRKRLESGQPVDRKRVQQVMRNWLIAYEVASVRTPTALAKIPAEERAAWEQLWREVRDLRDQAGKKK